MDIGICVEGQNDIEAIKSLLMKINSSYIDNFINYIPRYHRGYPNLIRNLHQTLFEFNRLNVNIIVILVDNDRQKKQRRFKELQKICKGTHCNYDLIAMGVAVEALEAWLLADENALSKLTNRTISAQQNPENIQRPDVVLKEITQYHSIGMPYFEILQRIVIELNLDIVLRRCKSFKNFYEIYSSKLRRFIN